MMNQTVIRALVIIGVGLAIVVVGALLFQSRSLVTGQTVSASDAPQIAFLSGPGGKLSDVYVYDHATQKHISTLR